MEIHALKLAITAAKITELAHRFLPTDQPIEDLEIGVAEDGLTLRGTLPLFIHVKFETLWGLRVQEGKALAQLVRFKAWGVPGTIFKSAVIKMLADAAKEETWLQTDTDTILVDIEGFLAQKGFPLKTNLTTIRCEAGRLFIEAVLP